MAVLAALAIVKARHVRLPLVSSSGCLARGRQAVVPLTTGQAEIAATIAGVALSRSMPVRAVTIAYAAALQESGLADLPYGDRDSVGVFQQRPSQGWGTRRQLLDPVYASARFFAALARVAGYQRLPVYQAAQAVQHSADGRAYGQYAGQGAAMATAFTGQVPHGVGCWYGSPVRGPGRLGCGLLAGHPRGRLRDPDRHLRWLPVDGGERAGRLAAGAPRPPATAPGRRNLRLTPRRSGGAPPVRAAATGRTRDNEPGTAGRPLAAAD